MASIRDIIRDYTLFVDGNLFDGDVYQVTLPKLKKKTEEYRGGAMDFPVDVVLGYEKLTFEFNLSCHSDIILATYGLLQGEQKVFTIYGQLIQYGNSTPKGLKLDFHGMITEYDQGDIEPGKKVTAKISVSCDYYKHVIGGQVVHEIDVMNKKYVVNGVDKNEGARTLLGIG